MEIKRTWVVLGLVASAVGCNVGTKGGDTGGLGGEGGEGGASGEGECPRGVAVVLNDYLSTQIALSSLEGETLSESVLSTASTTTDGLAYPLSGDVTLPSSASLSGRLVLIDRFGTNVISWVDVRSGEVTAQLPVGTGFESNPQDYLEISDELALVSRYTTNEAAGETEFDGGGDVLLVDPKTPAIVGRIELPTIDEIPPRPAALSRVGDEVWVTLERVAFDFSSTGVGMVVRLDVDGKTADEPFELTGLKGCGGFVPTPDGREIALACTGALDSDGDVEALAQSALVFFDAKKRPLEETRRVTAEKLAGEPIQSQFAFIDGTRVLVKTQTAWGGDKNNRLVAYDLESEASTTVVEAEPDAEGLGQGQTIGTIACFRECSKLCLAPNASTGKLERVDVEGAPKRLEPVTVESKVGLPPRGLGEY